LKKQLKTKLNMTIAIFGNWYKRTTLEEVAHVLDFMEQRGVNVLLAQELRDEMNLRDKYMISSRPHFVLVDRDGLIIDSHVKGDSLEDARC